MTSAEVVFARREECRKCSGEVWALYYFAPDGTEAGWGCRPIGSCGCPARCGEKLRGLDPDGDDHHALAQVRTGGRA